MGNHRIPLLAPIRNATIVFVVGVLCTLMTEAGEVLQKVMIPLRDGTKLAADVYLPDGDFPADDTTSDHRPAELVVE